MPTETMYSRDYNITNGAICPRPRQDNDLCQEKQSYFAGLMWYKYAQKHIETLTWSRFGWWGGICDTSPEG